MTLTEQFSTVPEFHSIIDSNLSKADGEPIVVMPMFLSSPPEELTSIAFGRKISVTTGMVTEDIFSFRIGLRKRFAKGFLVNYEDYWLGFLIPKNHDIPSPEVASRWTDDMFPIVTPSYLTSQQMLDLIDSLRVVEKSKLVVLDYVTRSAKERETTKRWKGAVFSKEQIASKAKHDNAIVDAIRITFSTPNFKFTIKLNRRGLITIYSGSFSELQRLLITKLIKTAKLNFSKMRDTKRVLQENEVRAEPLVIKPDNRLNSEDMIRLKESISRHYMTAVLYGGNPWLYLSLLDKSDGSSVDLQAYENEIIITPVTRVSSQFLGRLFSVLEEALPSSLLQLTQMV